MRRALNFLFLTGVALILLFFFGLPLVIKFAAFFSDIGKSSTPIEILDNTPPAPPQFQNLPEATNKTSLEITGRSESGATVFVFLNDKKTEIVADEEGIFTTKLNLNTGENIIAAQAKDKAGNEGQKTKDFSVTFDDEEPKLEISSPADGTEYSGSKNQRVTITGAVSTDATLTLNDRFISINEDGSFSTSFSLTDGENILNFKASDKAENLTEKTLTLKYTP